MIKLQGNLSRGMYIGFQLPNPELLIETLDHAIACLLHRI